MDNLPLSLVVRDLVASVVLHHSDVTPFFDVTLTQAPTNIFILPRRVQKSSLFNIDWELLSKLVTCLRCKVLKPQWSEKIPQR